MKDGKGLLVLGFSNGDRFQIGDNIFIKIDRAGRLNKRRITFLLPEGLPVRRLKKGDLKNGASEKV